MTFQSVRGSVFQATEQEQHKQGPKVWVYSAPPRTKSNATYIKEPNHTLWTIHLSLPLRTLLPLGWWTSGVPVRRRQEIHWVLALPRAVRTQFWLLLPLPLGQEAQGAERCRPH